MAGAVIELSEHTIDTLGQRLSSLGFKPSHAGPLLRSYYQAGQGAARNDRKFPADLAQWLASQLQRRTAATAGCRFD